MSKEYIPVLTVAGSDCSGGAGIQADIKTISAIGCYAMSAITAITCQNTCGVSDVATLSPDIVRKQIDMCCVDIPPLAAKTGMLFNRPTVEAVADAIESNGIRRLVVDPVMVSTSGSLLMEHDAIKAVVDRLFPLATLVTPNRNEAIELTGTEDPRAQADKLREMGCRNILLKGGDYERTDVKVDYLMLENDDELTILTADAVDTRNTHGTGCTLSSAIASYLALGFDIEEACVRGKLFVTRALRAGAKVRIGHGHGPVNHLFGPRHMKFNVNQNNVTNEGDNQQ
ncbi:MAG: bifunctional hydroxymethylpyrimidine kinase/phosphomethylpyrimidine kinase [Bacteroides sp.]|nr:bifunctional hydroxymethylpyrimidine kinase/phosphomethylpyrimidine kinase [Bacteroides sp.]MCM1414164.1 bifunctional hydroxymethylpyrimidine kinase/phosphomethylpyrimidine kinase [Bacteroides sp.]MCM1471286.1 bifunctional hydroxymethylpyrimidine kinase/phosphomethylpyrimidine kinase [Bacteroides sp.]